MTRHRHAAVRPAVVFAITVVATFAALPQAQAGTTTRVSVSSTGQQGYGESWYPSISADGRYVAFWSYASNLVPGDTNGRTDIFVHDRPTGATTRVSVSSSRQEANGDSYDPSISPDGRYVAFTSNATTLDPPDTNAREDVFVHDRDAAQTTRVSISSTGQEGNGHSNSPSISADGRYVAFESHASTLVPDDNNGSADVFLHDRQTAQTTRVSVSSTGQEGNGHSFRASVSADGRYVAFQSWATNVVPDDTNGRVDAFVHDRDTGRTTRVSVGSTGQEANGDTLWASISADGRYVAFDSSATNLVPDDTNARVDVFVHDRDTGQTTRVSVSSAGEQGDNGSFCPRVSADGRYVVFASGAANVVSNDTNACRDIFVHDRGTGTTTRVSVSSTGQEANAETWWASISPDGRCVAFNSPASNLVPADTNHYEDVFVHDRTPALLATEPPADGTLPKIKNNVILLTFDDAIWLPPAPPLSIINLHDSTDVSASFIYTLETATIPDDTLKAKENGTVLTNLNWYRLTPAPAFGVQPFVLDVCTLIGDADGDGSVLAQDYFPVKNHLFELTDARYDLDGNGQVLAQDYFVVKNLIPLFPIKPPKP